MIKFKNQNKKLIDNKLIDNDDSREIFDHKRDNIFLRIKNSILKKIIKQNRLINSEGNVFPNQYVNNTIDNRNYNLVTFLPKFLFLQFNSFNNFFYLLLTISQFFDIFKIGEVIGYIFPLAFILILTAFKEIYEEIQKFKKDKIINNSKYNKFKDGKFKTIYSKNIQIGNLLRLKKGDRVPADMIILWSSNEEGITNVKTDQIDGETDWKTRKSIKNTQKYIEKIINDNKLPEKMWDGEIHIDPPNNKIYEFNGKYFGNDNSFQKIQLENCIWSNMKVATNELIGVVIYIGKETKLNLNSKSVNIKFGKTDNEINILSIFLIFFIFILGFLMTLISGKLYFRNFYTDIIRNIILFSQIIPISLKVNLDLSKIFYMFQINNCKSIIGANLRNSNISEELGRIEFLLSDKTGTLTQNKMIFKTFALNNKIFLENDFSNIKESLSYKKENKKSNKKLQLNDNLVNKNLVNFFESLILCHNVTPIIDNNERILQASSPDEIALVNFAESIGYKLLERNDKKIIFKDPFDNINEFEILEIFPFTSDRKRMGILLKKDNEIKFYIKGADCVINPKLNNKESLFSFEQTEIMSKKGLRTLVIGYKIINENFYKEWKNKLIHAQTLKNSLFEENKIINELERNLDLVGITGVEDLLQDKVKHVIDNLREAGIKIWMLTGDKAETAKCISISTGFKNSNQKFFELIDESLETKDIIKSLKKFNKKDLLIVSGQIVEKILKNDKLKLLFSKISSKSSSVVICRCAPIQKAEITLLIKNELKKTVCSIGDGGNDVGMIKCSSFGIGIEGLEGKQAALSSDISIPKFNYIEELLLWHGRLNYLRTCKIFIFCITRGFLITFIQLVFMLLFYYISIGIYNPNLLNFYSTFFTNFLLIGILFDQDIPKNQAFNYPILYTHVQKGRYLNLKHFLKSLSKSLFQSFIIIIIYIIYFNNEYKDIIIISFSSLIIVIIINSYQILSNVSSIMHLLVLISLFIYIITTYFFSKFFGFEKEINYNSILTIFILSVSACLPFVILNILKYYIYPSPIDKVIKEAYNIMKRNKNIDNKNLKSLKINKVIF